MDRVKEPDINRWDWLGDGSATVRVGRRRSSATERSSGGNFLSGRDEHDVHLTGGVLVRF
jgi:hypothetical protein